MTAYLIVDLTFGDAGKGTITDFLARKRPVHTVIRFNGGAQAGHNVVTPDGRHHTFSQFGAATFVPGVRTHLSRFMILNPLSMLIEEQKLVSAGVADAFDRTTISKEALVVTPFQRAANRLREMSRGEGRHGSCGMGIGETAMDSQVIGRTALRAGDLDDTAALRRKLRWIQEYKRGQMRDTIERCRDFVVAKDEIAILEDEAIIDSYVEMLAPFVKRASLVGDDLLGGILRRPGDVIFEGAQGVLIDEWRGFDPYTTWSTCTFDNASALLKEHSFDGQATRIGVVRAYATRHGPGPFVTEDAELGKVIPDTHNRMDDWQRNFRIGWFDAVATRYAVAACGSIDALAVTGIDRLRHVPEWKMCVAYARGVRDIPLGTERDLAYQRELTGRLMEATPVYRVSATAGLFETRAAQHLVQIAAETGVQVRIASFGPAADDKKFLP